MTNLTAIKDVRRTETGAQRLARLAQQMREQRLAAERVDLHQMVMDGKLEAKSAGFASLLSQSAVALGQSRQLVHTVWELLGAYAL